MFYTDHGKMKAYLVLIAFIVLLAYLGDTTVSFSPFSVKVRNWALPISFVLTMTGLVLLAHHLYQEGVNDTLKELNEEIETLKLLKEKYNSSRS